MTQVNGREMESKDAPHVSHGVRGRSRLVKVIFYFISFLVFVQNTKYILSKEYQRSQSWVLECKLNSYWSKLRLREKHDVLLFSFFTCPLVPKTLLTQKSDSIFVHRLLRCSIFCCLLGVIFVPLFIIDFEIFIHFLYDKLRGLPRRVFTLFLDGVPYL